VLARVDLISMNAREAAILTGRVEPEAATAEMPARIRPGGSVVVRLGAEGCWVTGGRPPTAPVHLAGRPAKVVDTTGAGDVFLGALLAALSEGRELLPSARFANAAASISVERTGPSTGPVRSEVEAILTEEGEG
ncbi:MAG: carbohydrate kinase family protein, partial [Candidatus Dormibacteraceae bacterium]